MAKFAHYFSRSSACMLTGSDELYAELLPSFAQDTYLANLFAIPLFGGSIMVPSLRARMTVPLPLMLHFRDVGQTLNRMSEAYVERLHIKWKRAREVAGKGGGIGTREEALTRTYRKMMISIDETAELKCKHSARLLNFNQRMEGRTGGRAQEVAEEAEEEREELLDAEEEAAAANFIFALAD
jgi:hypothetical protein